MKNNNAKPQFRNLERFLTVDGDRLAVVAALSPGEAGVLGVALDDCADLGDDETVERLEAVCIDEDIPESVAYTIVHLNGRSVEA